MHLGRTTLFTLMDMVEVKACINREIGYWKNDTHDIHYSSMIQLATTRIMARFDAIRFSRANFFGDEKHKLLPLMIPPFI